jgi:hypothetical protein
MKYFDVQLGIALNRVLLESAESSEAIANAQFNSFGEELSPEALREKIGSHRSVPGEVSELQDYVTQLGFAMQDDASLTDAVVAELKMIPQVSFQGQPGDVEQWDGRFMKLPRGVQLSSLDEKVRIVQPSYRFDGRPIGKAIVEPTGEMGDFDAGKVVGKVSDEPKTPPSVPTAPGRPKKKGFKPPATRPRFTK